MYMEGLLGDEDVRADLHEVVTGGKTGRTSDDQFIYFNAIGLSFVDVCVAACLLEQARALGLGQTFDFGK